MIRYLDAHFCLITFKFNMSGNLKILTSLKKFLPVLAQPLKQGELIVTHGVINIWRALNMGEHIFTGAH